MTALDVSSKALVIARKNIGKQGLGGKVKLLKSALFSSLGPKETFDFIVSNPPYIPTGEIAGLSREVRSEPVLALDGGEKGLAVIKKLITEAPKRLAPGGWLVMEIGAGQSGALKKILNGSKDFAGARFVKDHSGIDRVLMVRKSG